MDVESNAVLSAAWRFAREKHAGQKRKYTGEPYITHPESVFQMLTQVTDDIPVLAAALLHDVIEDTNTPYADIKQKFNEKIADLVLELTNDPDRIRILGKPAYLADKLNTMTDRAFMIKLADRLDNVRDLARCDAGFAKRYVEETELMMSRLTRKLDKHEAAYVAEILKICRKVREHFGF
jgi:(p)ppGpp synthase/HD superfamily hydrolase